MIHRKTPYILTLCILCYIGFSNIAFAQNTQNNSFCLPDTATIYKTISANDTDNIVRVRTGYAPGNETLVNINDTRSDALSFYSKGQYKLALKNSNTLLEFALSYNINELLYEAQLLLANIHFSLGQYTKAQNNIYSLISNTLFYQDDAIITCMVYRIFYDVAIANEEYQLIFDNAQNALLRYISLENQQMIFFHGIYLLEAAMKSQKKQLAQRYIINLLKALKFAPSLYNYKAKRANIKNINDAKLYIILTYQALLNKDWQYMLSYYQHASIIYKNTNNIENLLFLLHHEAMLLLNIKQYKNSIKISQLSIKYATDNGAGDFAIAQADILLGKNYFYLKQYEKAKEALIKAYNLLKNHDSNIMTIAGLRYLTKTLEELNDDELLAYKAELKQHSDLVSKSLSINSYMGF